MRRQTEGEPIQPGREQGASHKNEDRINEQRTDGPHCLGFKIDFRLKPRTIAGGYRGQGCFGPNCHQKNPDKSKNMRKSRVFGPFDV